MKECAYCGRLFQPNSGGQKYCSKKCKLAKRRQVTKVKICEVCGEEFIQKQPRQIYCGYECAYKASNERARIRNAAEKGRAIPCKYCGKEFVPAHGTNKYCSEKCRTLYHSELAKKNYQPRECVICGEVFTPRDKRQVTCSNPECKKKDIYKKQQERVSSFRLAEARKTKKKKYTIKEWNALTPSERWELMTLNEVLVENIKYHIPTYGKSETLARWGRLPEDYGKRERKSNK
jgi:predicted nucleic acid-binding Zn ribbon protein